jgi:L-cysteine S-thiosulfotransferase
VRPIFDAVFVVGILWAAGVAAVLAQSDQRRVIPPEDTANPLTQLIAGEEFLPASMRAQQADDFDNPAYPLVEAGEATWGAPEGAGGKSCQGCHGAGPKNAIRRVAASYPKYAPDQKQVITLRERINLCRKNNLGAAALPVDSVQMTALVAYLRSLARGLPSAVDVTGPSAEVFERGSTLYRTKLGLLQLSCAQCHNERFGQKFGGETLSQGHPLAYPVYKSSEGRVISLQERFRICNKLARAEVQRDDSPDYVALELYINWRSKNLPITAPGVRP